MSGDAARKSVSTGSMTARRLPSGARSKSFGPPSFGAQTRGFSQIAVDDAFLMRGFECVRNLAGDAERLFERQRAFGTLAFD
jgi:hypothetical protein